VIFYVYPAASTAKTKDTAEPTGKILTDGIYYEIDFPEKASTMEKGLLLGTSILLNAAYFQQRSVFV
jgi:hypothetical protein